MISISVYVFPAAEFGIGIDICQYRRMSKSLTVLEPAGTAACCPPLSAQPLSQAQAEQVAPLLSQPTISHHLKVLHEAGLLDRDKRGVWVYYRARPQALASLGTLIGSPEPAPVA